MNFLNEILIQPIRRHREIFLAEFNKESNVHQKDCKSTRSDTDLLLAYFLTCFLAMPASFAFLALLLSACTNPTARERLEERRASANPPPPTLPKVLQQIGDHPEPRPYRAWQFYFKHCSLDERYPYPRKTNGPARSPFK